MRLMAAQDLARQHARQHDVVGKLRLAGALCPRIDFTKRLTNYIEWPTVVVFVLSHSRILPRINADERGFKQSQKLTLSAKTQNRCSSSIISRSGRVVYPRLPFIFQS